MSNKSVSNKPLGQGTVTQARSSEFIPDDNHGKSPAAWAMVYISLAGALIASIAFVMANTPLFVAGLVVMVVGFIVGAAMSKAGYGVYGDKVKRKSGH